MPDPLATVTQLTERTGLTYTGTDETRAEAALADASALVRAACRSPSWTAATAPELAVVVTLSAAKRLMDNPDALTSESYGSYSYSRGNTPTGALLTNEEKNQLRELVGDAGYTVMLRDSVYPR